MTIGEVRDGSEDPREVWDELGTLGEVRDESEDPPGSPGRVWGSTWKSGMGRGTLGKVRDGSGKL